MVNGNRIRKMDNVKLASLFCNFRSCDFCIYKNIDCSGFICFRGILKWLDSEVEDNETRGSD